MTTSKKMTRTLRPIGALRGLGASQLAAVRGGGILLMTLGQTKESSSQVALEQISINFEKLDPSR